MALRGGASFDAPPRSVDGSPESWNTRHQTLYGVAIKEIVLLKLSQAFEQAAHAQRKPSLLTRQAAVPSTSHSNWHRDAVVAAQNPPRDSRCQTVVLDTDAV